MSLQPLPATSDSFLCAECHELCSPIVRDFGLGSYEFWGASALSTLLVAVSPCCEAELLDSDDFSVVDVEIELVSEEDLR